MIDPEVYAVFRHYLNERETIRLAKESGVPGPWTQDPILLRYKFTNIRRSDDWTTRWAVKNWYDPNRDQPLGIQALNCAIFRYFGSAEFAEAIGYQTEWNPTKLMRTAEVRLATGKKVFTGAYIITNGGRSEPKQNVVVTNYLTPFRFNVERILAAAATNSWQDTCEFMQQLPGIGPFMSKEIALDLMLTPVLENAKDKLTWSPVGPGAIRGLNRLNNRPTNLSAPQSRGLVEMQELMSLLAAEPVVTKEERAVDPMRPGMIAEFPRIGVAYGITDIQFSLCELDKYLRVKNKEGRPRSGYDFKKARIAP